MPGPLASDVHVWPLVTVRFPGAVVVIGCGATGLLALEFARAGGALTLIAVDTNEARLQMAHAMGAEPVFNPTRQDVVVERRDSTPGAMANALVDAVGAGATRRPAVEMVCPRGHVQ